MLAQQPRSCPLTLTFFCIYVHVIIPDKCCNIVISRFGLFIWEGIRGDIPHPIGWGRLGLYIVTLGISSQLAKL